MADDELVEDGIDEANPPEEEVDDYPEDEEQNAPEGEDVEEPEPDLPDVDDEEFQAEIEEGLNEDA